MKNKMDLKIIAMNCEISETLQLKISNELEADVKQFPEHVHIDLTISQKHNRHWNFNLSMRHSRGHLAVNKNAISYEKALQGGLNEFRSDLRIHKLQWSVGNFQFDKTEDHTNLTKVSHLASPISGKKFQVMMLEDDPAASVVLKATLETFGFLVDHFALPQDALNAIEENKYDLLILDWNLPYMKCDEFLIAADSILQKAGKAGPARSGIPVVICTSMPIESIRTPDIEHFFIINHWHKSLPFSSILGSIDETTTMLVGNYTHLHEANV